MHVSTFIFFFTAGIYDTYMYLRICSWNFCDHACMYESWYWMCCIIMICLNLINMPSPSVSVVKCTITTRARISHSHMGTLKNKKLATLWCIWVLIRCGQTLTNSSSQIWIWTTPVLKPIVIWMVIGTISFLKCPNNSRQFSVQQNQ